ncbi:WG repeat-containing protein [Chryseobacterium sp. MA9]|uniref:WG repeat-containing protein n=1 Tax=Chryseobacterium sp. MA9 TaxID=2966625 RepID=UPI0021068493|nr:WG repeat-containing protein [Chryseobacterium sp. MA9]UTX48922.1 WG repeat-containing protein [Chryseobacterium sp. MA9]
MRQIITILFLTFSITLFSQAKIEFDKFPFNIEALKDLSYKKDSIMPKFIGDKFYYININTNKKISEVGFQVAYPFVGRKSTIIKMEDNFGVIDINGNVLAKPTYKSFQLWRTPMRENFAALCRTNNCSSFEVFDLAKGDFVIPDNGCAIPYFERERLISFKSKNKKYGVNQLDENYQNPKTVIKPVFDSIYDIRRNFITAKKNGKIGVVDGNNKTILPFTYGKIILSNERPNLIGLKNNSIWEYYNLFDKLGLVLKSKYECKNIGEIIIDDGFGIYKVNDKYNILFNDGTSLNQNYDWISDKGTIAIDSDKVYIFGNEKVPFLYYEK